MEKKSFNLLNSPSFLSPESEETLVWNPVVDTDEKVQQNFKYLEAWIARAKREISFLDLYKVEAYIDNKDEVNRIAGYVRDLLPNRALGIGVDGVSYEGVAYKPGDLLLKKNNGQVIKIPGPQIGVYKPVPMDANNRTPEDPNYGDPVKIRYQYTTSIDSQNIDVELPTEDNASGWNLISTNYGSVNWSFSGGYGGQGTTPPPPVIKCFNINNIEIACQDLEVSVNNNQLTIRNIPGYIKKVVVR